MFVAFGVFPYVADSKGYAGIFMCAVAWSQVEVIRFSLYLSKQIPGLNNPTIANILGHFRYNTFILGYPIGVSGELISLYYAYQHIGTL